ncbi:four helix bundle protein [Algoriphagus alkaliphilus]|uniref:Four helix bundle protein n=1 Tax=Algoriphagus alkaliphilus TaxID=279824 RepID=A0A1G5X1R6_9BACT|nr:four helix bundle protein [Algoriphagus alkaliphilus]MBA4301235.1 four helix bundle protein [Cyclobacterium sp.]SDA64140.1 four helix bundle protein [Algoriphagus alkaliphilus]
MDYRDLIDYKKAFKLAMRIFEISKTFPREEKFSLTDQIRRSSRSICTNIGEGYRKRRYPAHFISKLSDSDMENTETQVWLNFALACKYIEEVTFKELDQEVIEIGRLLNFMMDNPEKFGSKKP